MRDREDAVKALHQAYGGRVSRRSWRRATKSGGANRRDGRVSRFMKAPVAVPWLRAQYGGSPEPWCQRARSKPCGGLWRSCARLPPGAGEGDHVAPLRRKRRAHQSCDRNQASVSSERRPRSCHVGPAPRGGDQLLPIGRPLAQAPERLRAQPTGTPTRQPGRQEAASPGERRVNAGKAKAIAARAPINVASAWRTSAKTRTPIVSAESPSTIMAP